MRRSTRPRIRLLEKKVMAHIIGGNVVVTIYTPAQSPSITAVCGAGLWKSYRMSFHNLCTVGGLFNLLTQVS